MPALTERKLRRTGDSTSVALPPDWLRFLKLRLGDVVDVLYDQIVLIKPHGMRLDEGLVKKELELLLGSRDEGDE